MMFRWPNLTGSLGMAFSYEMLLSNDCSGSSVQKASPVRLFYSKRQPDKIQIGRFRPIGRDYIDKHFFETYFKENCSTQEVVGMNDIIEDMPSITLKEAQIGNLKKNLVQDTACEASEEGTPTNFIWTREATKYFLQKYAERKNAFQNPKIKKKTIWEEIQKDLTSVGYNIYTEILDRKMRNMKHSFKTIKDNNKKSSTGHGRIQ
ncbi:uncharacterized protein LOC105830042 isoform X2 [Monomorium pharaonis]|uniref:uncharacterized protein LOC105830042 isoform X2 n=1 Tax=Monomorium pharaonis TaxID=307658 RepID=UPI0017474A87|nr:uncharacterized protein LOC105830042 isoform X2 [Monomorium pharaonis]